MTYLFPNVSESKVQTVYTDELEPDSLSQVNPEVCSVSLTKILESQCQQSVNLDPAIHISNSEEFLQYPLKFQKFNEISL